MTAADRVTALGGCPNFRHMGGYPTDDGRVTRGDRLFRTGWLDLADPGAAVQFARHGIRQVYDFRLDEERAQHPMMFPRPDAQAVTALAIDRGSMGGYLARMNTVGASATETKAAMTRMYYEILDEGRSQFQAFLASAIENDDPMMIMCTLGKDRTGVASALLLTAVGVSWDDVLEDYMISFDALRGYGEIFAERANFQARGIDFDSVRDMLTVHPEYLQAMRQRAEEISGGLSAFIEGPLGVGPERRARLKDAYTR